MALLLNGCASAPPVVTDDYCLVEHYQCTAMECTDAEVRHDMAYACRCDQKRLPASARKDCSREFGNL
jgi:hypothetical protein